MTKMRAKCLGGLRTECVHRESGAHLETSAPKEIEGKGDAFSPTDLLAVSLSTCMLTVMEIQAKKLGVDLKGTFADVEKEMSNDPKRRIGRIIIRIQSPLSPAAAAREKLEEAAMRCPVYLSLHDNVVKEIDFVWGLSS